MLSYNENRQNVAEYIVSIVDKTNFCKSKQIKNEIYTHTHKNLLEKHQ